MKTSRLLLIVLLLLLGNMAHAEGNCPIGYYSIGAPQGQAGPQSCAPIPGYSNGQQQQHSQQSLPARWASRWGAIATDGPGGHLGAATNLSSKNDAENVAIADCQIKGGSACEIEVAYDNECAAMVVGQIGHSSNAASTLDEAIRLGMSLCNNSGDTKCHVYYSACSLPVRIQ